MCVSAGGGGSRLASFVVTFRFLPKGHERPKEMLCTLLYVLIHFVCSDTKSVEGSSLLFLREGGGGITGSCPFRKK